MKAQITLKFFDIMSENTLERKSSNIIQESKQGRTEDALALRGDEGRGKLR